MSGRSGPARIRELAPHLQRCLALAFGKIFILIAEERDRRESVSLRAEQSVMLLRPGVQRLQEALVGQFGESFRPIMADRCESPSRRPRSMPEDEE